MLYQIYQVLFVLLVRPLNLHKSVITAQAYRDVFFDKLRKPCAGNRRKLNNYWGCFQDNIYYKSAFKLSLLGQFLFLTALLWFSLKSTSNSFSQENRSDFKTYLNGIEINCELINLPNKLSCVWIVTRDVQLRKWSKKVTGKSSHVVLLILLAGDIATDAGPRSSTPRIKNTLRCLYLNARSLVKKLDDLKVLSTDMDIIAVTETWLKPDIKDCELLPKLNFTIFRKDRLSRQGGGVMLAIRNTITCFRRKDLDCKAETLFCEIRPDSKRKFLIAVFYRPLDSTLEYMKELKKSLRMSSEAHFEQLFLCGDFNLPNINWKTGTATTNDAIYNCFTKLIRDNYLWQLVDFPTRNENVLDGFYIVQCTRKGQKDLWV